MVRVLTKASLVAVAIGAILVVGGLLLGTLTITLTIPRFSTTGPVVRNGVAVIVACGKKSGLKQGFMAATAYAPEARTGTWAYKRRGNCTVWYHHPRIGTSVMRVNSALRNKAVPLYPGE